MLPPARGQGCCHLTTRHGRMGNCPVPPAHTLPFRPRQTPRSELQKLEDSASAQSWTAWEGPQQPSPLCFLNSGVNFFLLGRNSPPSRPPRPPSPLSPTRDGPGTIFLFHLAAGDARIPFPRCLPFSHCPPRNSHLPVLSWLPFPP